MSIQIGNLELGGSPMFLWNMGIASGTDPQKQSGRIGSRNWKCLASRNYH